MIEIDDATIHELRFDIINLVFIIIKIWWKYVTYKVMKSFYVYMYILV